MRGEGGGGAETGRGSEMAILYTPHVELRAANLLLLAPLFAELELHVAPAAAVGGASSNTRSFALYLYFFLQTQTNMAEIAYHTCTSSTRSPLLLLLLPPHRHAASSRSSAGTIQGLRSGLVLEYIHLVHELMFPVHW